MLIQANPSNKIDVASFMRLSLSLSLSLFLVSLSLSLFLSLSLSLLSSFLVVRALFSICKFIVIIFLIHSYKKSFKIKLPRLVAMVERLPFLFGILSDCGSNLASDKSKEKTFFFNSTQAVCRWNTLFFCCCWVL